MNPAKKGDHVYLENAAEVRWFLEHIPQAVRDALVELNIRLDSTGRIIALPKMGCPFGNIGCVGNELVRDPLPFADIVVAGPER